MRDPGGGVCGVSGKEWLCRVSLVPARMKASPVDLKVSTNCLVDSKPNRLSYTLSSNLSNGFGSGL